MAKNLAQKNFFVEQQDQRWKRYNDITIKKMSRKAAGQLEGNRMSMIDKVGMMHRIKIISFVYLVYHADFVDHANPVFVLSLRPLHKDLSAQGPRGAGGGARAQRTQGKK